MYVIKGRKKRLIKRRPDGHRYSKTSFVAARRLSKFNEGKEYAVGCKNVGDSVNFKRTALKVGDIRNAVVKVVEDWGCLVLVDGVLARLSGTDLSHEFVADSRSYVAVGDTVQVVVKSVRMVAGKQRISVSAKDLVPDPWYDEVRRYVPGQRYEAIVSGFHNGEKGESAVFVKLGPSVEALANLPVFGVRVGDWVVVKFVKANYERRRVKVRVMYKVELRE